MVFSTKSWVLPALLGALVASASSNAADPADPSTAVSKFKANKTTTRPYVGPARKPVLVHYANDIRLQLFEGQSHFMDFLDNHVRHIHSKLATELEEVESDTRLGSEEKNKKVTDLRTGLAKLEKMLNFVRHSIALFNDRAETEANYLKVGLSAKSGPNAALASFRNGSSPVTKMYGKSFKTWQLCGAAADRDVREIPSWELSKTSAIQVEPDFYKESQPLSSASVFQDFLTELKRAFPPEHFEYILVVKSYSDAENVLRPLFSFTGDDVVRILNAARADFAFSKKLENALLDAASKVPDVEHSKFEDYPSRSFLVQVADSLRNSLLPEAASTPVSPLSKYDFLNKLSLAGGGDPGKGMYFRAVVLEGNQTALELSSNEELKKLKAGDYTPLEIRNIGTLYTLDGDAKPNMINYKRLFSSERGSEPDFATHFEKLLE